MKKGIFFLAFAFLATFNSVAQLQIQGEFRPRFEYRRGYRNIIAENQEDAIFISQRTRLSLYYSLPKVSFGLSIQDVRIWGDETSYSSSGVFGDNASMDLNEAWINIALYSHGNLKLGRQYWTYEDERLVSVRNWNQSQVKYDAILFQHKAKKLNFDVGLSWNNSAENISGNDYPTDRMKTLNFAYLKGPVAGWADLSAMVLVSGFTRTDSTPDLNLQATYAGYANFKTGDLKASLSGFYQNGRSRAGKITNAFMFSIKGDYRLNKVTLGAGIDYLSGNDAARDEISYQEKEHSFDLLYGARHKYYGHLDYFSSLQKATGSGGLVDIFLKFSWKFTKKASLNADLHHFSLQNNVKDLSYEGTGTQYLDKKLGPEADLNISWDILDCINLKAGYSVMFPGESMIILQGMEPGQIKNPQWIWVMVAAKPDFLNTGSRE
jgi:hypothetical protein